MLNFIASCNWINGVHKVRKLIFKFVSFMFSYKLSLILVIFEQLDIGKLKHSLLWWTFPALSINYCIFMVIGGYFIGISLNDKIWFGVTLLSLCYASVGFLVFYAIAHLDYYFLKKTQRNEMDSSRSDISYIKTDVEDELKWHRKY